MTADVCGDKEKRDGTYRCQRCQTAIMSGSRYCISCYRLMMRPCLHCCTVSASGKVRPRKELLDDDGTGRCRQCMGERWILQSDDEANQLDQDEIGDCPKLGSDTDQPIVKKRRARKLPE